MSIAKYIKKIFKISKPDLEIFELKKVFTPATVAKLTYISRSNLENELGKNIDQPGQQIVVYGYSGGGKTTLIRNQLSVLKKNFIHTHCESTTTFEELLLQAFDKLDRFYISEKTSNNTYSINSELKAEYIGIKAKISTSTSVLEGTKSIRMVPPQLTSQKLAEFLGEVKSIWIIEDFHKVTTEEKKRIADVLKVFIDTANDYEDVKVVCIGAVGTARELVELDNNLKNRVAEIFVPLLEYYEMEKIIEKGCELLNIGMDDVLKKNITYYSNNLAALTHQMCYDICYHNEIMTSQTTKKILLKDDAFNIAMDSLLRKSSDTFAKLYDSIASESCGKGILRAFENYEKECLSLQEIQNKIPKRDKNKISDDELYVLLEKLGTSEFEEIIRFDKTAKKYLISDPFFEAFLKTKIAKEKSEHKERMNKRNNKKNNTYSIIDSNSTTMEINDDFKKSYFEILNSIITKQAELRQEINRINEMKEKNSNP